MIRFLSMLLLMMWMGLPAKAQWQINDPDKIHYFMGGGDSASLQLYWKGNAIGSPNGPAPMSVDSVKSSSNLFWTQAGGYIKISLPLQEKLEGYTERLWIWHNGQHEPDTVSVPIRVEYGTQLLFKSTHIHLYDLVPNETRNFLIRFKNVGLYPAKVRVRNSGGSSFGSQLFEPVPPGGEGEIELHYAWRGSGYLSTKTMVVEYNSPQHIAITYDYFSLPEADTIPLTQMVFDSTTLHFGAVRQGERVRLKYHFRNAGAHPLLIEAVKPAHGGVVATHPREAIPSGGEGDIEAEFNTSGNLGEKQTIISVVCNGEPRIIVLTLKGHVMKE